KGFKEAAQSPDWPGGLYDGKIRLPIGEIKDVSAQFKAVIYHEYSHVVVRSMTGGKMVATWLNEGIAEYEGARFSERKNMKELTRGAKEKKLIPVKRLESSFTGLSDKESSLAYLQSYSLVKHIIDRFGFHAVRDILDNIARGNNLETALKKALDPFELDYASLVAEWEGTLK
ncbi:MAG: Tetratricopeptide 2 repeat protein, partial [Deltaproteobacteria bacterium]|nr:Tetratricopeptide 2 repeat protein [Deltaproteobacteria bacterium]